MWFSAILFSFFLTLTFCEEKKDTDKGPIVRARLEVKAFIRMLLPHYHDVNIMYIPGKDPAMVFLNAKNKVVLEEDVSEKSKEEICQILEKHGMMKSEVARDEVPEEPEEELEETYEEEGTWGEDQETGDEEEEEEEPEDEEGTEGPGTEEHEDEFDAPDHTEL